MISVFAATLAGSAIVVATADANDFTSNGQPIPAVFQNLGSLDVWVGGTSVSSALGLKVAGLTQQPFLLYQGDVCYAIGPAGGSGFRVIMSGVV